MDRHFKMLLSSAAVTTLVSAKGYAVTWEEQAERLQNVSATLLDGVRVSEVPAERKYSLGFEADISILPKVNPKVGAKKENVPSSPVHMIPTLFGSAALRISNSSFVLGVRPHAGYLAPGAEKLLGLDATLTQIQWGGELYLLHKQRAYTSFVSLGYQSTSSELKGAIAAVGSEDKFDANSKMMTLSSGVRHQATGLWTSVLLGTKNTKTSFFIEEDDTTISTVDRLADSMLPLFLQATVGWHLSKGFDVSLSQLYVPDRVLMPRLSLSWQYAFGSFTRSPSPNKYSKEEVARIQEKMASEKISTPEPEPVSVVPEHITHEFAEPVRSTEITPPETRQRPAQQRRKASPQQKSFQGK